jgi:hypothetical protein
MRNCESKQDINICQAEVGIQQQSSLTVTGKSSGKINRNAGFAGAAFAAGDGYNLNGPLRIKVGQFRRLTRFDVRETQEVFARVTLIVLSIHAASLVCACVEVLPDMTRATCIPTFEKTRNKGDKTFYLFENYKQIK